MAVKMAFTFIMTPAIVRALGNYDYGLWEIVFSLVGYMGLLDIGMRPAVVRYVAKYDALNDRSSLDKLFTTSFSFSALIGLVGCIILLAWAKVNPELLAEKGSDSSRYVLFLSIIAFQILIQFPGYVAECFHAGYQRYHLFNAITIINTIIGNSIIYYMLINGYGLLTLALGNAIGLVTKYILYFALLFFDKFGGFRLRLQNLSRDMLAILLTFGGKSAAAAIASTVAGSVSNLVIGFFLGPATIPYYSIPSRLVDYLSGITTTITNVFMPAFSQLHASERKDILIETYITSTKYICAFIFPMLIGISMLGKPFIGCWIGIEYANNSGTILYILACANIILLMNPLFNQLVTGINQIEILLKIRVLYAIILVIVSLVLVKPMGAIGIAIAFLVASILAKPLEFKYTSKALDVKCHYLLLKMYGSLFVPNILMFIAMIFVINWIDPVSYLDIAFSSLIGCVFYLIVFFTISISSDERKKIASESIMIFKRSMQRK
jgi:O-antigen/teichoic acid export membrane protein